MYSKLADDSRKALIAEARRLTREERLQAFVRHSKLVTQLYYAGRQARAKSLKSRAHNLDSGLELD